MRVEPISSSGMSPSLPQKRVKLFSTVVYLSAVRFLPTRSICAITLPDAVYILLSYTLTSNLWVVSTCLFIEQFGYGLGFTVLTLYMLYYSQGKFRTSHYSICTGISYLGLMLPGMVSGYIKDLVGYQMFFIIVMACCLITFLVTAFLKIDPDFGKK